MSAAGAPGAALLAAVAETPFEALPKPAVEMGRLAMLDWWGVTVGGVDEPVTRLLREAVPEPEGPASVLGTARTASPVTAALWNGTASHALDYDDTVLALPGHVCAPLLPGLLALAETRGATGRDVLTAFVLGVEVMCRVSRALAPGHYRAGWHATATLGRLGGAAACARLLGLDAPGIDRAVGLAAAQLGGIHESFGTMGKPFQVGRAAADGLLAALVADGGMTGPSGILDRPAWARRLSPDWTPARLADGLGQRLGRERGLLQALPVLLRDPRRPDGAARPRPAPRSGGDRGGGPRRVPDDPAGGRSAPARHGARWEVQHHLLRRERAPPRAPSGRSTSPPRRFWIRRRARWPAGYVSFPRPSSTSREPGPSCGSGTGLSTRRWGIFAWAAIRSGSAGSLARSSRPSPSRGSARRRARGSGTRSAASTRSRTSKSSPGAAGVDRTVRFRRPSACGRRRRAAACGLTRRARS